MKYTVVWEPSAEQDLATIWMRARDKQAVRAAADQIDTELERDPLQAGESREGNNRIFFFPPLAVSFDVDTARRRVLVLAVWRTEP